jgi:nitrile hydratase accessory protein
MAIALCERGVYPWDAFQGRLIAEIAVADRQESEVRPTYYECWLAAFEALLLEQGILSKERIDSRAAWLARAAAPLRARAMPWLLRDIPDDEE